MRRTGIALSGLVTAFLALDSGMKLLQLPICIQSTAELGYPIETVFGLGLLLAICTVLYAIPRTTFLGAVLLTGYLGGAVASHLRIGSPMPTHVLFGVWLGMFVWGGLFLRDARLRDLFFPRAN